MKAVAIVLARAGSKGLPMKNQLPLLGKPMLAWTLEHALASERVDRVILSTDGPTLAEVGRRMGVEVVDRPAEYAHDTATVDAAARHALTSVIAMHEAVVILYGNVPVRPGDLTDQALDKLEASGADSVQSVCPVGKHHPYWVKQLAGEAGDEMQPYVENSVYRRQDLPPTYQLDGGVIAVTRQSLFDFDPEDAHSFLGRDRRAVVTRPGEVVDVDTSLDLRIAEATLLEQRGPAARAAG
jgi:CMP-N-acetylneuraminic acid synthetase